MDFVKDYKSKLIIISIIARRKNKGVKKISIIFISSISEIT